MSWITGTYYYQIDPKGRVRIPPKIREKLGSELSIGYGAGEYLVIYSQETIDKLAEKYSEVEIIDGDVYDSVREMFGNIFSLSMDNQDRYQIPVQMRERVGLKDDIVFVGVVNKLEVWSLENYNKRKEKSVSQSNMADFKALK